MALTEEAKKIGIPFSFAYSYIFSIPKILIFFPSFLIFLLSHESKIIFSTSSGYFINVFKSSPKLKLIRLFFFVELN